MVPKGKLDHEVEGAIRAPEVERTAPIGVTVGRSARGGDGEVTDSAFKVFSLFQESSLTLVTGMPPGATTVLYLGVPERTGFALLKSRFQIQTSRPAWGLLSSVWRRSPEFNIRVQGRALAQHDGTVSWSVPKVVDYITNLEHFCNMWSCGQV